MIVLAISLLETALSKIKKKLFVDYCNINASINARITTGFMSDGPSDARQFLVSKAGEGDIET